MSSDIEPRDPSNRSIMAPLRSHGNLSIHSACSLTIQCVNKKLNEVTVRTCGVNKTTVVHEFYFFRANMSSVLLWGITHPFYRLIFLTEECRMSTTSMTLIFEITRSKGSCMFLSLVGVWLQEADANLEQCCESLHVPLPALCLGLAGSANHGTKQEGTLKTQQLKKHMSQFHHRTPQGHRTLDLCGPVCCCSPFAPLPISSERPVLSVPS